MERKLALITGGTSGIGLGVAESLSSEFNLALIYASNDEKAEKAKERFKDKANVEVKIYKKPLSGFADAEELIQQVESDFNTNVSVLVNAAGHIADGLYLGSDFSEHKKIVENHLIVTMATCHLVLKKMYKQKYGRIINLSSISARYAKRGQTSYAAAKAGIEGFTKTLALEVAHRNVTVNAIAPGLIETPMTSYLVEKINVKEKIPAARVGTPNNIGKLAAFLVSDEGSYITGQTIVVDGGRSLGDTLS